mmetsp:Transcript_6321/g.19008  ORF Transcript_6321/g.19008 Transcript_6321/m.19008 type:complete len:233 (+) Transcript_6321:185-883(+)
MHRKEGLLRRIREEVGRMRIGNRGGSAAQTANFLSCFCACQMDDDSPGTAAALEASLLEEVLEEVTALSKLSSSEPTASAGGLMCCGSYGKLGGSRMPPSPGKKMRCMSIEHAMMTMPSTMKPRSSGALVPEPMMNWPEMTAPMLPPAPTMPETTPSAGRETKGTTPKWRPSAIWTNIEKTMMMMSDVPSVPPLWMQSGLGSLTVILPLTGSRHTLPSMPVYGHSTQRGAVM